MDSERSKLPIRRIISQKCHMYLYLAIVGIELKLVHRVSDLPVSITIGVPKAEQLTSFQIPTDNFYGPGASMLSMPFLWLADRLFHCCLVLFPDWHYCFLEDNKLNLKQNGAQNCSSSFAS
jgi:hypothetical protein